MLIMKTWRCVKTKYLHRKKTLNLNIYSSQLVVLLVEEFDNAPPKQIEEDEIICSSFNIPRKKNIITAPILQLPYSTHKHTRYTIVF